MPWRLWVRPIVVCAAYYGCLLPGSIWVHDYVWDWMVGSEGRRSSSMDPSSTLGGGSGTWATFLAGYALWLLVWRVATLRQSWVFYEYCWLCNFTLVASAVALWTHRPYVALTYCIVVSVDQFLWYVDLLYYCTIGRRRRSRQRDKNGRRFLVGVCQYVFDDQVSWHTRVTCTHHLWTIPLVVWGELRQNDDGDSSSMLHEPPGDLLTKWCVLFGLSGLATMVHVLVSRAWIPLHDPGEDGATVTTKPGNASGSTTQKYLNVNLGHALWKDVTLPFLQINHPHAVVYVPRLILRWQCLNGLFALVLLQIVTTLSPPPSAK